MFDVLISFVLSFRVYSDSNPGRTRRDAESAEDAGSFMSGMGLSFLVTKSNEDVSSSCLQAKSEVEHALVRCMPIRAINPSVGLWIRCVNARNVVCL